MSHIFKHFLSQISGLLKKIFGDIFLMYKNFVHWVVHKILLKMYGFFLGIVFAIPFLCILAVLMFADPINWMDIYYKALGGQIYFDTLTILLQNIVYIFFEIILICTAISVFALGWSYANILQLNLYKNYIDGKKLGYAKNAYFELYNVWTYIKITAYIALYWLYIILGFLVFGIIVLAFGVAITGSLQSLGAYIFSTDFNIYSILLLFGAIVTAIIFVYINYRVYFSTMFFVDDIGRVKKHHSAKHYIKLSLESTQKIKTLVYFFISMSVISICIVAVSYPLGYVDTKKTQMEDYANYISETGAVDSQDIELLQYYEELQQEYNPLGYEQFLEMYSKYAKLKFFLGIFYFIVLSGVMEMAVLSFYRHQVKKHLGE